MRFTVPQFIEHEAKIFGPLTFRQTVFMGSAAGASFFLYFSLAKTNFSLFLIIVIALMAVASSFFFFKNRGPGLADYFGKFFQIQHFPQTLCLEKKKNPNCYLQEKRNKKRGN
jgi:hypothetical protein